MEVTRQVAGSRQDSKSSKSRFGGFCSYLAMSHQFALDAIVDMEWVTTIDNLWIRVPDRLVQARVEAFF